MIGKTNLKVLVLETDFYARQAINSYLAWDRRTRVVHLAETLESVREYMAKSPRTEWPDVVLLDALAADSPEELAKLVRLLEDTIPNVMTLVLDRRLNLDTVRAVEQARANGYLLRDEMRIRIAWAICWAVEHDFVVTKSVKDALEGEFEGRLFRADVIPPRRVFPELTDRVRQALHLCVVEGMSADLAADEMGISAHTVRSYVKEGYRILEAYDDTVFPPDYSPQERAFMRLTMLVRDEEEEDKNGGEE
ncbi:MAG: response regulator transcription factor [Anaerolineae bacterium]|nr:response regulator transcription factor [Anaerolineae bacterium]